jgi:uroporphyrinogen decarboxylase
MNSAQRVRAAVKRDRLPDRVPLQFDLSRSLLEQFSRRYGLPVRYTRSYLIEDLNYRISANELRIAMGSDCVVVGAGVPAGYAPPADANGHMTNEFGMVMRPGPLYMELVRHPLAGVETVQDIAAYRFPDPLAEGRYDDAAALIKRYQGEYFIWGDIEGCLFAPARHLVGMEKLLRDMATGEAYVEALLDRCLEFIIAVGTRLAALGVDGLWGGDDFGGQTGLLISPKMWRRLFKERYRQLHAALKAVNPDLVLAQHSCGAVAPILDDWIETGLEVFNPVQPNVPGHAPEELKRRFGQRLAFWGGVDQQRLLPFGAPAEIAAEVRQLIETLGVGGGYLIAPAHIIQADTPLENVEAFIAAVKRHGVYAQSDAALGIPERQGGLLSA